MSALLCHAHGGAVDADAVVEAAVILPRIDDIIIRVSREFEAVCNGLPTQHNVGCIFIGELHAEGLDGQRLDGVWNIVLA